jgi:hypothetical protein
VVDVAFYGSVSRIGGLTFDEVQRESESAWIRVRPSSRSYLPMHLMFRNMLSSNTCSRVLGRKFQKY